MSVVAGVGAYGLRLDGVDAAGHLLTPADPAWPALAVERLISTVEPVRQHWDEEHAVLRLHGGCHVGITRRPLVATFRFTESHGDAAMVHPFLSGTCAVVSRWFGRESFHGGAFERGGRAWAVVGDRAAGKSSAMGWLAMNGYQVLTDDLVVIDGLEVLAGPRCLDLRTDAAAHLGVGDDLGVVGARRRWRVSLPSAPTRLPLGGWIIPAWGDSIDIAGLPPLGRLAQVMPHLMLHTPLDAAAVLELAAVPCLRFARPAAWSSLSSSMEALLTAIDAST